MSRTAELPKKPPLLWVNGILFSLTFLATVSLVPWYGLAHGFVRGSWVAFWVLAWANGVAITAGYHRLWAHKTYEAHWSVRLVLMIFGTMALQASVWTWCSGHRTHHRFVDDIDLDPYSARRGFWFAHIGWMLRRYHIFAHDYRNGIRAWHWDPTKWLIAGLSYLGLTNKLRRTSDFQIQQALLTMQFKRAEERLRCLSYLREGGFRIESLRSRLAQEYERFTVATAEWARLKEQWVAQTTERLRDHWQHAQIPARLREIENQLRAQSRYLRRLQASS